MALLHTMEGIVVAVSSSPKHALRKSNQLVIRLLVGHGVEGDAHAGETVQHRSRRKQVPLAPNLRQVHLIQAELHDELGRAPDGKLVRKASVMSIVIASGEVHPGDPVIVELPEPPYRALDPV